MTYIKTKTDLIVQNHLTNMMVFIILFTVMIINYSSFFYGRLIGLISILISFMLLAFTYYRDPIVIWKIIPSAALCFFCLFLLFFSGRWGERGFWAPIYHAYKYIYLLLAHCMYMTMRSLTDIQKKIIILAAVVSSVVTSLYSAYYVIYIDEYAMRYGDYTGVANFSYVYGIVSFAIIMITGFLFCKKQLLLKLFLFASFLAAAICIALSLFTTALFLLIFGIGTCILLYVFDRYGPYAGILLFLFLSLIVCFFFLFSEELSDWIYKQTEGLNWIVRVRVRSVIDNVLDTEHNLGSYNPERRKELASFSLESFLRNPLFGVRYSGFGYGVIGNHQEWQDMLGVFGLIGSAGIVSVLVIISRQILSEIKQKVDFICFIVSLAFFVILGFLNPCFSSQNLITVFVLAPNISILFLNNKRKEEKSAYRYVKL